MKTDDLIKLLAADGSPVARHAARLRLGLALVSGTSVSVAWLIGTMGLRPHLAAEIFGATLWIKLLFPASIAVAACVLLERLARPGARVRRAWLGIALPAFAMAGLAVAAWVDTPSAARASMLWGGDWRMCLEEVLLMALPVFVMSMLALRGLAPTRPGLAGAVAGAMSGAAGASVYALHCPETALPFVAVWYGAGMLLATGLGGWIGERLLRW